MKRALVVIDVQESFRQRPNWPASSNPEIAKQVHRLAEAFRARDEMIVWVLHTEPGTGNVFDPDSGYVRLMDGLTAAPGESVISKTSFNAFYTTDLQQQLTSAGITEVVVCGIRTEQCVETTARDAAGRGYDVTYVIDATATNPIEHRDAPPGRPLEEILADPLTLQVEDILARTEYALAGRFATITTVAELTGE
jgi:nicotinamidase-related amidase